MSFSLDWSICTLLALTGVLTFALLGCSLRRMRARDRLTVIVWWVGCTLSVGSGLWASWALGLAALTPGPTLAPLQFQPLRLGLLAVGTALTVAVLHFIARLHGPEPRRIALQTLAFSGMWAALLEVTRHSLSIGLPVLVPTQGVATLALSTAIAAMGCVAALCVLGSKQGRELHRMWIAGALLGGAHAAALLTALHALHLDPAGLAPGASHALPPIAAPSSSVGIGTLMFLCGVALMLVLVGLTCSWLDSHAHVRNRLLATSLNDANRRLRDQAHSDPLTRMPNRLMFEERMKAALLSAGEHPQPCSIAVLFIDLDGFKPINDSFGHVAGDTVLREIGARLKTLARLEDTVARVGGDEFLLMMMQPGHEAVAASVAQRVLQALNEPLTLPNDVTVNLSGSIGIVMYPEHGPAEKLIANADAAMYAAKRAGGSTYAFFEPRMELDAREQLALQNDLRHAIERNELQLYYQPKIDGKSGQITGVEALLRWQHAVRGFVSPALFIPIAERFGLIGVIGNWVIDEACRQLRDWTRQGLRMRVAVNLSVHQLRAEDLVQRVQVAIDHFGVDAQLLTFEITESVAMEDTQETLKSFAQLAAVGVSLSIDDFGTGYSSLAYLRKLPAKQLKIDQSFVQDLDTSPDALAVVDAVIKLAHALGLRVVAEGVETARQRDILLGLQCDELQGYLFARPMAARMLTLWAMGESTAAVHAADPEQALQPGRDDFRASLFMDENGPDTVIDILG